MLYYDLNTLELLPTQNWVIHNVIPRDGLVVLYGVPGCCKTFIMLDMCLRVANNMPWCGKEIQQPGIVVYVMAEGVNGIKSRIKAWHDMHRLEMQSAFVVVPLSFNICDHAQAEQFIQTVLDISVKYGDRVSLVVFDTLSRVASGLDENSSKDVSSLIRIADNVKKTLNCTVVFVHHGGKDNAKGMRGSSSLLGAVDTCIKVTRFDFSSLIDVFVEKQKDGSPGEFHMELKKQNQSAAIVQKTKNVQQSGVSPISQDQSPIVWVQRKALLMAAKKMNVYGVSGELGKSVSAIRVAVFQLLRENGDAEMTADDIVKKYHFYDKTFLPISMLSIPNKLL